MYCVYATTPFSTILLLLFFRKLQSSEKDVVATLTSIPYMLYYPSLGVLSVVQLYRWSLLSSWSSNSLVSEKS